MSALEIELPRKARDTLVPMFTKSGKRVRFRVLYGGRDGGKSHSIARIILARGMAKKERILCVRETQNSILDSVHKLLSDLILEMGLSGFYTIQKTSIFGINGTEIGFYGLSTETRDSMKSKEGTTICWVEEAHIISKRSWDILEPTIRAQNSEIIVSFNPDMDTDETYIRFIERMPDDAIVTHMNFSDNPWRSVVLDSAREKMQREAPEDYANIYEGKCRPAALGAIYTPEMTALAGSNRVGNFPPDPMLQVHTIWDLGFNDSCAVIFVQRHLSELRIVDYLEDNQKTLAQYVTMLDKRNYRYGIDWLPWDGADSKFKLTGDGTSPESILRKMGRKVQIVPQMDVEVGIKKTRLVFPRCYFDREKTVRLRECLKRYRRNIPTSTNEPAGPVHDEFSHGADAFRYLAVIADKITDVSQMNRKIEYPKRAYA